MRQSAHRPLSLSSARRMKRNAVIVGLTVALPVLAMFMLWTISRRTLRFPAASLRARRPSRVFTDRHGRILRAELGDGDCWQIPVPLRAMSPHLVNATVAVEDKRFWCHHGVDWVAAGRAVLSNARSGRTVSGASTISMQLARMVKPEPRTLGMKCRQVSRALDLERIHGKCWILEQ